MRQVSRLLVLLSLISLISSAQSESAVQTTSQGQSAVFRLPDSDNIVVGLWTEHTWPLIKYTASYLGKEILKGNLESFQWTSQWTPLLLVSKEVIKGANLTDFPIPADLQRLDTRHISLLSKAEVQWQMMTLPRKDRELQKATPGDEVFLDLPEEDDVWVAVWNKRDLEFRTELKFFGERKTLRFFDINTSKHWSIICISDKRISYGNDTYRLSKKDLKGRRLQMKSYDEVHFQVFPVPLKSTDATPPPENTDFSDATPPPENNDISDTAPPPATLLIAIAVIATSMVILGIFFGCRFFWKKRNAGPTEGTGATSTKFTINSPSSADEGVPKGGHFRAVSHFGLPRPSSSHDSENSLYGAVIHR